MSKFSDDYCHLSGFDPDIDQPVFYAHDGSECTILEVQGMRDILSTDEATTALRDFFGNEIGPLLKKNGHFISVSHETSGNTLQQVERLFRPIRDAAKIKELSVEVLVNEAFELTLKRARYSKTLVACWTKPDAVLKGDLKEARSDNKKARSDLPPAVKAMQPFSRLEPISAEHGAFVGRVASALDSSGVQVIELGPDEDGHRPDLAEVRKGLLFHETPDNWKPFGPGDRKYPGVKSAYDSDLSEFFAPPLSMQIMSAGMIAKNNMRSLQLGGRAYALAAMQLFPRTMYPFNDLMASIKNGADPAMPMRVSFHIEGGPFNVGLKQVLASFASLTGPKSKNLFLNLKEMSRVAQQDRETFVKCWIVACTWREPNESEETLERRRSYLIRSMMGWGDAQVSDTTKNPMMSLAETVPGMVKRVDSIKPTFVPMGDMSMIMPFHSSAPVFERGETIFTTTEGKIAPHNAFSSDQNYWLTLIFATPGAGKSVLMNRLNYEFTAHSKGRTMPFVCVIDIGVSSSGFIRLIQEALPEDRRHEAYYRRLFNDRDNAVNFLDIGLGRRSPLSREKKFIERFLVTLIGDETRQQHYEQIVQKVVTRIFQLKSDLEISSSPNTWEAGQDPRIDEACEKHGIPLSSREKWWSIVDKLVEKKDFVSAIRAQRHAMPLLQDVARVLSEQNIISEFDESAVKFMKQAINSAIERYPIFSFPTKLDFGEARVISVDLNDVKQDGQDAASYRNNSLMYMIARHLFVQKIGGDAEEISSMDFPRPMRALYQTYWERRYEDIAETPKRLCFDEYHMTGGAGGIAEQVLADVRVGRKWGMEIILASQLLRDFEVMQNMASTIFILKAETNELREQIQNTFGFSDAVKEQLYKHVHGTGKKNADGVNFLANYKLKQAERWIVLNNFLGPTLLWALTTRAQDRNVREECYKRFTVNEALSMLALRYPDGTVGQDWDVMANANNVDETSIARRLVDRLIVESVNDRRKRESAEIS